MKKSIYHNYVIDGYFLGFVNENTKAADSIRARYNYAVNSWRTCSDIYGAYKNPSIYKVRAWNYCRDLCRAYNGSNLMITGYNCMSFSVMFEYPNPDTGERMIAYITKDYNRTTCYS
jgi:hypothetical protein